MRPTLIASALVLLGSTLLLETRVAACEIVPVKRFETAAGASAAAPSPLPAPLVETAKWRRGAYLAGQPCGDDGALTFILGPGTERPRVDAGQLGLRVRLIRGTVPFVVPDFVVQVLPAEHEGRVVLSWREPHGIIQPAIDADLDLTYVDADGHEGPSTRLHVRDGGRGWGGPAGLGVLLGLVAAGGGLWLARRRRAR